MPAKTKKTPAKKAGASKASSTGSKLSRLFSNKKFVVILFVLAFGLVGSYKLYSTSAASDNKTVNNCASWGVVIRSGSEGGCVRSAQEVLNAFRNTRDPSWRYLTLDGKFGPNTKAAVIGFQKTHGLVADGVVGPKTWAKFKVACDEGRRFWGVYIWGCSA